tara:strand:- start:22054 stop:23292 length:1239 start_codon:yes stop_codon:yes gene_type:complete
MQKFPETHQELFNNLISITQEEDSSFHVLEHFFQGHKLFIFDYHQASYNDFLKPSAIEARGITFHVDENNQFKKLISLPMQKFFNYKENPSVIGIDHYKVEHAMFKEDGSLISSMLLNDNIFLKSKGSPVSEQAERSNQILQRDKTLYQKTLELEKEHYTVNFEYTSPTNMIVLPYAENKLTVLNARNRLTGNYLSHQDLVNHFGENYVVDTHEDLHNLTAEELLEHTKPLVNIEGFVSVLKDPDSEKRVFAKYKSDWYKKKHQIKDSINHRTLDGKKAILYLTLEGHIDDVRQDFIDDPVSTYSLNVVEERVIKFFNHEIQKFKDFKHNNQVDKNNRKEVAILLSKNKLHPFMFGAIINNLDNLDDNKVINKFKENILEKPNKLVKNWEFPEPTDLINTDFRSNPKKQLKR